MLKLEFMQFVPMVPVGKDYKGSSLPGICKNKQTYNFEI